MTGTRCTCGQGHATFGACIRAKGIRVGQVDRDAAKAWQAEINAYRSARRQGVQPRSTKWRDIRAAMEISEKTGQAFTATGV